MARQVERAEARHAAKVASSEARGFKYPESKYRPYVADGRHYAPNGTRETARRIKQGA